MNPENVIYPFSSSVLQKRNFHAVYVVIDSSDLARLALAARSYLF